MGKKLFEKRFKKFRRVFFILCLDHSTTTSLSRLWTVQRVTFVYSLLDEGIARTSSDSSTTSKEPLSSIANSMSSYTTFRSAFDWSEMGAFVGPTLPHSFSTSILKNNDMNNNSNNICSNGNKKPSLKKKIPLSRAKSRSLDSINRIFSDLNVSTIFDQDIDEIFPPLCRYKSEDGDQMFGGGGANDYALQQGVQQEGWPKQKSFVD